MKFSLKTCVFLYSIFTLPHGEYYNTSYLQEIQNTKSVRLDYYFRAIFTDIYVN